MQSGFSCDGERFPHADLRKGFKLEIRICRTDQQSESCFCDTCVHDHSTDNKQLTFLLAKIRYCDCAICLSNKRQTAREIYLSWSFLPFDLLALMTQKLHTSALKAGIKRTDLENCIWLQRTTWITLPVIQPNVPVLSCGAAALLMTEALYLSSLYC